MPPPRPPSPRVSLVVPQLFLVTILLLSLAVRSEGKARIVIVKPAKGEVVGAGGPLEVAYRVEGLGSNGEGLLEGGRVVEVVANGNRVHVSGALQQSLSIGGLEEGTRLSMILTLGMHSEEEGFTEVLSAAQLELDIGGVSPSLPPSSLPPYPPYVPAPEPPEGGGGQPLVIAVFHSNRPEFLALQAESLRRFVRDPFHLVVIDDSPNESLSSRMQELASQHGADHRKTPDYIDHSDPSVAVGKVVTWAVHEVLIREHPEAAVLLLEGDMFAVADFSPLSFLEGYGMAGTHQHRVNSETGFMLRYLWVGFLLLDLPSLPNRGMLDMKLAEIGGVGGDTASALHRFLQASPEVRVRRVLHTSHVHRDNGNLYTLPPAAAGRYNEAFRVELYERAFLHSGSGSFWKLGRKFEYFNAAVDLLPEKTEFVEWFVRSCIEGSVAIEPYDFVFGRGWEEVEGWMERSAGGDGGGAAREEL